MTFPHSIREINSLSDTQKADIYKTLLPPWLNTYGLDFNNLTIGGQQLVDFRCPNGSRSVEISVRRNPLDRDPLIYFHMVDTLNNQLLVLLAVVNDPDAPRFDVDVTEDGKPTDFGTIRRNLVAEEAAMRAGLAPGQVRRGLRVFRQTVPHFEQFVRAMGHDLFLIEPLAYHNAISFERYGFSYIRGYQDMVAINRAFSLEGELYESLLNGSGSPFRHEDSWRTVRGRSWAIHDGILGHPFTDFQMFKRINVEANVNTFPGAEW